MKRTRIEKLPFDLPRELENFINGAAVYDSSCSPEARVYFIDKDGGYYLKRELIVYDVNREAKSFFAGISFYDRLSFL